ncbi:MAG: oxidoreductase, partial [Rhodothermales bacterium]|nr:oxidoreductase [Rhodothermales bacterium]
HESDEGGGMMIGEMVHFIDLMQFVAGAKPVSVHARAVSVGRDDVADRDNLAISLAFDDGSVGTLNYNTIGDKAAPKERLEVFGGGMVAVLDDFRRLDVTRGGKISTSKSMNQDKGQSLQIAATLDGFKAHGAAPIPFEELVTGMRAVFAAGRSLSSGESVSV